MLIYLYGKDLMGLYRDTSRFGGGAGRVKNWVEDDGDIMSGVRGSDVESGVMVAVRSGVELIVRIQWY